VLLLFDERKAASLRRTLNVWKAAGAHAHTDGFGS
jgi:hypothetical protein